MCKVENFGHLLAIAFSLSAIFYYLEMRSLAEDRLKTTSAIHDAAKRSAYKRLSAALRLMIWPFSFDVEETENSDGRVVKPFIVTIIVFISKGAIYIGGKLTVLFVVTSTFSSLGGLIYAGYYPDSRIGCGWMTTILVVSYISIIWNLLVYVLYIPAANHIIRHSAFADKAGTPPMAERAPPP